MGMEGERRGGRGSREGRRGGKDNNLLLHTYLTMKEGTYSGHKT